MRKSPQWGRMAVDPTANATWIASHELALNVGDPEIVGGYGFAVASITDEPAQAYQRLNLSSYGPGPAPDFAVGQTVTIKNEIGLWVEFSVRTASGNTLALKPTTQKV